ncbi:chitin synthase-domain-containing protein [Globomyces pollinis-pini]|nr:chitin synthase-domain-containing protein [Globomyces pollinis-pini]
MDSVTNVQEFRDQTITTMQSNLGLLVAQWFLISISLVDFTIYTLNFLYGLYLAIRNFMGLEKLMILFIGVLFLMARFLYIPFLIVLIPLRNFPLFPSIVYKITFFGLFLLYVTLLIMPLFFAIRWAIKYRMWRNSDRNNDTVTNRAKRRIKKRSMKNKIANMIVVMPIYNEDPEALTTAVQSVVDSIYPASKMVVYLSFDSDEMSDLVVHLLNFLTGGAEPPNGGYGKHITLVYQEVHFVINLFPHGGKRNTQALTFQEISLTYAGRERGTYVLFIDSDIILHKDCMLEFLRAMETNKDLVGMTGFISAISSRARNFYWYFQDCEYVVGQVFARSLEAALGGVTCLPGALTIIRLKELSQAAKTYFSDLDTEDIFDFHRYHLGEDRYLTHLLMEQSESYSLGFCPSARAKTEAPGDWASFLKQRRRWLLGAFSNEVYFVSDYRLWLRVPILILYKILDFSSRSAAFFIYIVVLEMISGVRPTPIQTALIWFPLAANWLLLLIFAITIRRFKIFYMYPIMIMLNPWICMFVNIYSIFTWNLRSWGGPRADQSIDEEAIPESLLQLQDYIDNGFVLPNDQDYDSSGSTNGATDSDYDSDSSTRISIEQSIDLKYPKKAYLA